MVVAYVVVLPFLETDHKAFWSSMVGCCVGSLVAIAGAIYLWRKERLIVISERRDDREAVLIDEHTRSDSQALRQYLATIGNMRALLFNTRGEDPHATGREEYLMEMRLQEFSLGIYDQELKDDLKFITEHLDDDQFMAIYFEPRWLRLHRAHDWLLRIIALKPGTSIAAARPHNFNQMVGYLAEAQKMRQEMYEEHDKLEQAARAKDTVQTTE